VIYILDRDLHAIEVHGATGEDLLEGR